MCDVIIVRNEYLIDSSDWKQRFSSILLLLKCRRCYSKSIEIYASGRVTILHRSITCIRAHVYTCNANTMQKSGPTDNVNMCIPYPSQCMVNIYTDFAALYVSFSL